MIVLVQPKVLCTQRRQTIAQLREYRKDDLTQERLVPNRPKVDLWRGHQLRAQLPVEVMPSLI